MSHKEQLATKRTKHFIDTYIKALKLYSYQAVIIEQGIKDALTSQEQIDLFKPANVKLLMMLLTDLMTKEVEKTKDE